MLRPSAYPVSSVFCFVSGLGNCCRNMFAGSPILEVCTPAEHVGFREDVQSFWEFCVGLNPNPKPWH